MILLHDVNLSSMMQRPLFLHTSIFPLGKHHSITDFGRLLCFNNLVVLLL